MKAKDVLNEDDEMDTSLLVKQQTGGDVVFAQKPIKLKPCPFCGRQPVLKDYGAKHGGLVVSCFSCDCHSPIAGEQAIASWNMRGGKR